MAAEESRESGGGGGGGVELCKDCKSVIASYSPPSAADFQSVVVASFFSGRSVAPSCYCVRRSRRYRLLEMNNNQDTRIQDTKLECYNQDENEYKSESDCETFVEEEQAEYYFDDDKHIHDVKTIDYFIDETIWDKIGKELKDYDENDMEMLKWKSLEDCIEFYSTYAKVKGFGVRLGQSVKSRKDGHVISKKLLCRKEGHREERWMNLPNRKKKEKPIIRVGCQAFIKFKFYERYQYWKVENFHAEHNHKMVKPTHVSYIRSFRKISELDEIKIKSMHNSGIAPNRIMRHFVNEVGSVENVGFISKDLYNFLHKIKREEVKDGDAETVMAHTRDELGNLEKLFWCDGISRTDYKEFGHVLAFDTTYKCNAYNKPFVILVGVNHHRNTVPFGCALVVNENVDTYVWVLEQLIAAGDGYKPVIVITDRDKAMANSISKVLPEARHRLCLWHIMRNIKHNGNHNSFYDGFMRCADKCRTPNDFEQAWNELVDKHKVGGKRWVQELYEDKEKWAEAYLRGYFYAVLEIGKRKPKKTKRQASSSIPTHVPCDEDDGDITLDLHKTFEPSLNKSCDQDMMHTNVHQLAGYMPDTYEKDDISKASYDIELKKMEKEPTIFYLQPNKDW
ncbi:hypothetical protein GQ457_11G029750 [Hibiscus cannabinus]